jgi:hypothetical protein
MNQNLDLSFLMDYINKIKNNNLITLFNNSHFIIKLVVLYIVFLFAKNIITSIISLVFYTAIVTVTIYYVYNSIKTN